MILEQCLIFLLCLFACFIEICVSVIKDTLRHVKGIALYVLKYNTTEIVPCSPIISLWDSIKICLPPNLIYDGITNNHIRTYTIKAPCYYIQGCKVRLAEIRVRQCGLP